MVGAGYATRKRCQLWLSYVRTYTVIYILLSFLQLHASSPALEDERPGVSQSLPVLRQPPQLCWELVEGILTSLLELRRAKTDASNPVPEDFLKRLRQVNSRFDRFIQDHFWRSLYFRKSTAEFSPYFSIPFLSYTGHERGARPHRPLAFKTVLCLGEETIPLMCKRYKDGENCYALGAYVRDLIDYHGYRAEHMALGLTVAMYTPWFRGFSLAHIPPLYRIDLSYCDVLKESHLAPLHPRTQVIRTPRGAS